MAPTEVYTNATCTCDGGTCACCYVSPQGQVVYMVALPEPDPPPEPPEPLRLDRLPLSASPRPRVALPTRGHAPVVSHANGR